jgi:hypothetical protein
MDPDRDDLTGNSKPDVMVGRRKAALDTDVSPKADAAFFAPGADCSWQIYPSIISNFSWL